MNKKLFDQFFKEHEVDTELPSAAALTHFSLTMASDPEVNENLQNLLNGAAFQISPEKKPMALEEKKEIESANTYDQVIRLMRRPSDKINESALVDQALKFENDIVPEIVTMLKKSMNDYFVEMAILVLAKSKIDVTEELLRDFDNIRSPYTQSIVLVFLGFQVDETHLPWLIEKYEQLERDYPEERYHEGAYYAIYELENRLLA